MTLFNKNTDPNLQFQLDSKSKKIVILFGWSGSSHKNLGKYSQIYQDKGFSTFQVIQDPVSVLPLTDSNNIAEKLLKNIDLHYDLAKTQGKLTIIFHIFSNGGFVRFYKAMDLLDSTYSHWKPFIKGIFFDSCPGKLTANSGALAASAYSSNIILRNLMYFFFYIFFSIIGLFMGSAFSFDLWTEKAVNCKVFDKDVFFAFIYSKTDDLIDYLHVEEFIKKLEKVNKNVKKLLFEKSPHVQHLIKNTDQYLKIMNENLSNLD